MIRLRWCGKNMQKILDTFLLHLYELGSDLRLFVANCSASSWLGCYGPSGNSLSASLALKTLVKELHRNGIEVILDVVYSHTAENGDDRPKPMSFRGIHNATYYICDKFGVL